MISVSYLIVCVNLLYFFNQAETISHIKTVKERKQEQALLLNSLTEENQIEFLAEYKSPYWNYTYDEQLSIKLERCKDIVDSLAELHENKHNPWIFDVSETVPSPVITAYKNIDEFGISIGVDGNAKTVGILLGKQSLGRSICFSPAKLVTIKESHKKVAQVFERFIRSSPIPPCLKINKGGHWRRIRIRSNEAGEVMAAVIVQSKGYTNSTVYNLRDRLKEYFFKHLPNITLFHQKWQVELIFSNLLYNISYRLSFTRLRCTHKEAPFNLVYGKPYLKETLNGYYFKILPDTFFPVNKLAAELLFDNIIKTAQLKPNTTVLDICSGTGIISIMASKFVRDAVGIDFIEERAIDANYSAELNNIHNVKFVFLKTEKKLKEVLDRLNTSRDIVVIINSGDTRIGLDVISIVRKCKQITRLVYISDKPYSRNARDNMEGLCSKKKWKARTFRLAKAIPVDLLPQTDHNEIILMFQRAPHRKYLK